MTVNTNPIKYPTLDTIYHTKDQEGDEEEVKCVNCGNEYPIQYTEPFGKAEDDGRVCHDCISGMSADDIIYYKGDG